VALGRIGPSFLNPEKQPVFNEDGKRLIVFEGELFDPSAPRQELEHNGHKFREGCDAEVALHAFEQGGAQGIAKLAGAYVGCIYDSESHACHIFADRLGLRGCYYGVLADGCFAFASELKGIAALPRLSANLDVRGVAAFLNGGFPFFERTFLEEVKFLPYGSVLTYSRGRISTEQYWDMPVVQSPRGWQFDDAAQEGAELLAQAVTRQIRQPGAIGALLSGGLDSRAIVAAAADAGRHVPTFTIGAGRNMELRLATRVAAKLSVPHEALPVSPDFLAHVAAQGDWYTDAMIPCTHHVWLPQLPHIAQRVQSILSGYLGGVFLGGVFLKSVHMDNPPLEEQRGLIMERLAGQFSPFVEMALTPGFCEAARAGFAEARQEMAARVSDRGLATELERAYLGTDERRAINMATGGLIGTFVDVKFPFGDYDLLDFGARLPPQWRLGSRVYKAMLCRAFPHLVAIPCISANTQFVPTRLDAEPSPWRLRKRRWLQQFRFLLGRLSGGRLSLPDLDTYVHYEHWYRTVPTLRRWMESILLDDRTLARGYYDREGVRRLLRMQMARGYLFTPLAAMVTFEHWNRFFVDRQPPSGQALTMEMADDMAARQKHAPQR
jgi:asparagine synthase (glutamine-hydrolysing)